MIEMGWNYLILNRVKFDDLILLKREADSCIRWQQKVIISAQEEIDRVDISA